MSGPAHTPANPRKYAPEPFCATNLVSLPCAKPAVRSLVALCLPVRTRTLAGWLSCRVSDDCGRRAWRVTGRRATRRIAPGWWGKRRFVRSHRPVGGTATASSPGVGWTQPPWRVAGSSAGGGERGSSRVAAGAGRASASAVSGSSGRAESVRWGRGGPAGAAVEGSRVLGVCGVAWGLWQGRRSWSLCGGGEHGPAGSGLAGLSVSVGCPTNTGGRAGRRRPAAVGRVVFDRVAAVGALSAAVLVAVRGGVGCGASACEKGGGRSWAGWVRRSRRRLWRRGRRAGACRGSRPRGWAWVG